MMCQFVKKSGEVCGQKSTPEGTNCRFHVGKVGFKKCVGCDECDKLTISKSGLCTSCGLKSRKIKSEVSKAEVSDIKLESEDYHINELIAQRAELSDKIEILDSKIRQLVDFKTAKERFYAPVSIVDHKY